MPPIWGEKSAILAVPKMQSMPEAGEFQIFCAEISCNQKR